MTHGRPATTKVGMRVGAALLAAVSLLALAWAIAQGDGRADATTTPDAAYPARLAVIRGTETEPPDAYADPGVLKPPINLETTSIMGNLPVRQHPINLGLFATGCAQCHRLSGPLPERNDAPADVFDLLALAQAADAPPAPTGFVRLTDDPGREEAPAWSPDGGRILYERQDADGRWSLWVAAADGSGAVLLPTVGNAGWGEWSPDGNRIVYWGEDDQGRGNLFLVGLDGEAPTQLTFASSAAFPVWSPDGSRIAYQVREPDGNWAIRLLDPDDGTSVRVTPNEQVMPSRPQFSPDGRTVAYQVLQGGTFGLWRLEFAADEGGAPDYDAPPRSLPSSTMLPMDIGQARGNSTWSPDGRRIALQMTSLTTTPEGELRKVYKTWLVNADGTGADLVLPTETLADRGATFGPTGTWLAQWSWEFDLSASVWLVRPGQSAPAIDLTETFGADAMYPAWSPDGTRIAFAGNRAGSFDIWIVDVAQVIDGFAP